MSALLRKKMRILETEEVGLYKLWDNSAITFNSREADNFNCNAQIRGLTAGQLQSRTELYGSNTLAVRDTYCTVVPTAAFGDDYHMRCRAVASSSWHNGALALNTWFALTSARTWHFDSQENGPDIQTQDYDVDISDDGGSTTLDTVRITIRLTWDSP